MNQLKEIFVLSLFILLLPLIVLGEEYEGIKADSNVFLINTSQDNFCYYPFNFQNQNKFFPTFSNSLNEKNNKEFCIENLNINIKKELSARTKENYTFRNMNLNNDSLNYSNKVKITNSSYELDKDKKNLKLERGVSTTTYEVLKFIGSTVVRGINANHSP